MVHENPQHKYILKLGNIEDILHGEGEEVENSYELFSPKINKSSVLGVYKKTFIDSEGNLKLPEDYEKKERTEMIQGVMEYYYGKREKMNADLIRIVYGNEALNQDDLIKIKDKDVSDRVRIMSYPESLDLRENNLYRNLKSLQIVESEENETKYLNKAIKTIDDVKKGYGLTREEEFMRINLDLDLKKLKTRNN